MYPPALPKSTATPAAASETRTQHNFFGMFSESLGAKGDHLHYQAKVFTLLFIEILILTIFE